MNPITPFEHQVESIQRFQSLSAGQYWKSKYEIPDHKISADLVLLISSIKWVDDKPHTIVLKYHPTNRGGDGEHRFLTADFLEKFDYCENGEEVRAQELLAIQNEVQALQDELVKTQSNPELLAQIVRDGLDESTSIVSASSNQEAIEFAKGNLLQSISSGISAEKIENVKLVAMREAKIAGIKANWIASKTAKISNTINKMVPFFSEKSAAALAMTEDVRAYANKITDGVANLNLYIGDNVVVNEIKKGQSANRDIPLTIVQKKLIMDEELAVYVDVDEWFDFNSTSLFFKELVKNPDLVNQIFPTERCVLVMATTHRYVDYGEPITSAVLNNLNHNVFLMVRDGENLYQVISPVESHLRTSRLFPSKNDQNAIFKGMDGSNIKFDDIRFTDRLQLHEQHALHYKRFLILLCGLDHRLNLFGNFHEEDQSLSFVSMRFQEKYFNFLHDDDGEGLLAPAHGMPSLYEWIESKNKHLRNGSRVFCYWPDLISQETCPKAYKYSSWQHKDVFVYELINHFDVKVVSQESGEFIVSADVKREYKERVFKTKVNLTAYRYYDSHLMGYLCLDNIEPSEVDFYIHDRKSRRHFLNYIKALKLLKAHLILERQAESEMRSAMKEALIQQKITEDHQHADHVVNKAVAIWRAEHHGAALPTVSNIDKNDWTGLLDLMYRLCKDSSLEVEDILSSMKNDGRNVLRIGLDAKGQYLVFTTPYEHQINNHIEPHAWVNLDVLTRNKKGGFGVVSKQTLLHEFDASIEVLYQSEEAKDWFGRKSWFKSLAIKNKTINECGKDALIFIRNLMAGQDANSDFFNDVVNQWKKVRHQANLRAKQVSEPSLIIPVGLVTSKKVTYRLCITIHEVAGLLYSLANDGTKNDLLNYFSKIYRNKSYAKSEMMSGFDAKVNVRLYVFITTRNTPYFDDGPYKANYHRYEPSHVNFLLSNRIKNETNVYLHADIKASDLDDAFNLKLPDPYQPCFLSCYTFHFPDGVDDVEFRSVVDFYLTDNKGKKKEVERANHELSKFSSGSGEYFCSLNEAEEFIKKHVEEHGAIVKTEMIEGLVKRVYIK